MTRITALRPRRGAVLVTLADGTEFLCSRDFCNRARLWRGQEIEPVLLARLQASAAADWALAEASRLARKQRYSRQEIGARLQQAGHGGAEVRTALTELEERGDLNEAAVALGLARKALQSARRRDPALNSLAFRRTHARRLAMRGFAPATVGEALQVAWSEWETAAAGESLAQDQIGAYSQ